MEKPSEETSSTSSPLSRVHGRQICGSKDADYAASDGESASDNTQQLPIRSCNEDKESNVQCIDASKQDELSPAGNLLVQLQDGFPPRNTYQTFQPADVEEAGIDTIQSCDDPATPYSEFSQVRRQLQSLVQTQAKITKEAGLSGAYSPNINTNPSIESYPIIARGDYSDIRDGDRHKQVRNGPFDVGQSYTEPKLKQEIPKQEDLESQSTEISYHGARSLGGAQRTDCNTRIMIPETLWYPHEVTVDVKAAEAALQRGPLTPRETSPRLRSLLPVRETAPPREIILSPIDIPQIVLQQGPLVTFLAKPAPGLVKVDAQSQMSSREMPTVSSSADNSAPQKPPPPYSECMRHMASPISRETEPLSPKRSGKAAQPTGIPEILAPLGRTNPNLYVHGATRYRPLNESGTSLLNDDVGTSVYARNKLDGQIPFDDRRTTFMDNEHQFLAFISCLFCWPIGLVAIYYSNMCQILKSEGNYAQAQVYSRQAFIVSTLAMCAGTLTYIIMVIYRRMW